MGIKWANVLLLILLWAVNSAYGSSIDSEKGVDNMEVSQFPEEVSAGDPVFVKLNSRKKMTKITGTFYEKEALFFKKDKDDSDYYALLGTDVNQKDERAKLDFTINYEDGTSKDYSFDVKIKPIKYPEQKLTLPEDMVEPSKEMLERIKAEQELVIKIYSKVTSQPQFDSTFSLPLDTELSSTFGGRRILNGTPKAPHLGIDMKGEAGKVVNSSNSGTVVFVRDLYFTGNTVIIDHGLGLFTAYFHLNKSYKNEGDTVKKGEPLGEVGMTGRATGPHLHFGVKLNGFYVNPVAFIALTEKLFLKEEAKTKNALPE